MMNKKELENRIIFLSTQISDKKKEIEIHLNNLQKICEEFKKLSEELKKIEITNNEV